MRIELYKTISPPEQAAKSLTDKITLTGNVQKDLNMLHPEITIPYNAAYLNYNYCYIPLFSRYYFLGVPTITNNSIILPMDVDALSSHIDSIKSSIGHITRTNTGSKYLVDNMIVPTAQHDIQCRQLGTGFTKQSNYIITIGG